VRLRFYGQNGEDALLWRFFNRPKGFYVDVGAFDGVYLSNTKIFEEEGWDGVCVEALPEYADLCRRNRHARVVNAAVVGDSRGEVELHVDPTGLFSGRNPPKEAIAGIFEASGMDLHWETVYVPAATLSQLLNDCPPVDFLSLDIERGELDALQGLGDHRPRVLLVESDIDGTERKPIDHHLETLGYRLARSLLWNHFYAQGEDVYRLREITAVAWLQRPPHPLRPELSAIGYAGPRFRVIR
jgi:FkbM family methyltransferase